MAKPQTQPVEYSASARSDASLVRDCLKGHQEAWEALIEKYKNLIYSIPIKRGLSQEQATDIFQEVCLELIAELPRLRNPQALPKWLIQVTAHKCYHLHRAEARIVPADELEGKELDIPEDASLPDEVMQELEQEQMVREAVASLSERCRRLIHLLFFETAVQPYKEIAKGLGLATGSIGFIRGRCLERLRTILEDMGF